MLVGVTAPVVASVRGVVQGGDIPSSTLPNNLVSWWELNEESGTRVDSVIATGNDLTDNNTVLYNTGIQGNAASFINATNESLSIINAAQSGLNFGDTDWTMALWAKWASFGAAGRWLFAKDKVSSDGQYLLYHQGTSSGNTLRLVVFDNTDSAIGAINTTATFTTTGTWYHIVVYHSATDNEVGIIVDDGTPDTAATTGAAGDATADFQIGNRSNTGHDGLIDEFAVWSRKLTSAEITELYNSGSGMGYPG